MWGVLSYFKCLVFYFFICLTFSWIISALQAMISVRQRQGVTKLRLRSLRDATTASQEKARRYESMLRPHMQRPPTTALVARRLVEGALGKRSSASAQQISNERKQLKEAKGQFFGVLAFIQKHSDWGRSSFIMFTETSSAEPFKQELACVYYTGHLMCVLRSRLTIATSNSSHPCKGSGFI